jgi:hypothetical protein
MDFVVYKKLVDEEPAVALVEELKANHIEAQLSQDRESLDSLYGQKVFNREFFVKIRRSDIGRADALLEEQSKQQLGAVDKDHYLFSFTDVELLEILEKPDEWNEFDFQLAKKMLRERGHQVDDYQINRKKSERLRALAEPLKPQPLSLALGYLFAVAGGPIGVIMGWHIATHKKPLPNGQKIYAFTPGDRMHGRIILIMGTLVMALIIASRVLDWNY